MGHKPKSLPLIWAEYLVVKTFVFAMNALPLEAALAVARVLGLMVYWLDRRHRQVALSNLCMVFGERLPHPAAERLAKNMFQHFAMVLAETARLPRIMRPYIFERYVRLHGQETLDRIRRENRGAIFVTGHLGNWELPGLLAAYLGFHLHTIYRPLDNPLLDRYVKQLREFTNQRTVPRDGGLAVLLRAVRRGGHAAILIDQHAGADGVWVNFFGRPASTTPAAAILALRTGAPIVIVCACRSGRGFQYDFYCDDPLFFQPSEDREADIVRITAAVSERFERYVRRFPDQWLWGHRRWRTPPGRTAE